MCKYFSQTPSLLNVLTINALQNLLFCILKAALLHGKSVGFATQNSRFRNAKTHFSIFNRIIFTKLNRRTLIISLERLAKQYLRDSLLDLLFYAELTLLLRKSGGWLYFEHHSFVGEEAIGEDGFCFA